MMADGCSPSAIQAEGNRQYRLLEDEEWDIYQKIAEQANKREEKEAKSKEAQVNRLIAGIRANVRVLRSVLFHRCFASCAEILISESRKFLLLEC